MMLDGDDLLLASGLVELMGAPITEEHYWISTNRTYIKPKLGRVLHKIIKSKTFAAGELPFTLPNYFHPNNLLLRASVAQAIPYPSMSYHEDLMFCQQLATISVGRAQACALIKYRHWPAQLTEERDFLTFRNERLDQILERCNQLRIESGLHEIKQWDTR